MGRIGRLELGRLPAIAGRTRVQGRSLVSAPQSDGFVLCSLALKMGLYCGMCLAMAGKAWVRKRSRSAKGASGEAAAGAETMAWKT